MGGGELTIFGDAGKNACVEMQNGFVRICGNVDSGFAREVRRGMLIVEGKAHGETCVGLRGGTVILLGGAEDENLLANGMHRGTILLPGGAAAPDGFVRAADVDIVFLRLLFRLLEKHGASLPSDWDGGVFTRWVGDAAGLGKGETFIPAEVVQ
jgi:formylmethanofuran dehydrogenase subunit C